MFTTRRLATILMLLLVWAVAPAAESTEQGTTVEPTSGSPASAVPDAKEAPESVVFERLRVIDRPVGKIPGSVSYLGREVFVSQVLPYLAFFCRPLVNSVFHCLFKVIDTL